MRYLLYLILVFFASAAAMFGIIGFPGHLSRTPPLEVFPDMNRQLKLRPEKPFDFLPNGLSSQLPPPNTISRGYTEQGQAIETVFGKVYAFEDSPVNTGCATGTTNFVATNPLPVTGELLRRGQEQFDIYCTPCHGGLGDGNGITKKIGVMPAVANLHDQRIVDMNDGEIFHTITHGKGLMGAYGPLMTAPDRWAAIAYLRALELSQLGSTNELSAGQRAALK
jgi:mono/diheme cytochrome c family protein